MLLRYFLVLSLAVFVAGCGKPAERELPTGKVAGTVTYKDKPVTIGSVIFQHQSGEMTAAAIGSNGEFAADVPLGPNKVLVQAKDPERPNPDPGGRPYMLPGKSHVPDKYNDFNTSGLTLDVKAETPFDLKLAD